MSSQDRRLAEIFRHHRPQWFNSSRGILTPLPHGGISFLFLPSEVVSIYHYWVSICPEKVEFSARSAVAKLRLAVSSQTAPWGTITLSDEPILETALRALASDKHELPTTVISYAQKITAVNVLATHALQKFQSQKVERSLYAER